MRISGIFPGGRPTLALVVVDFSGVVIVISREGLQLDRLNHKKQTSAMRRDSTPSPNTPPTSTAAKPARSDLNTLKTLLPYLWVYKWRVLAALTCLIGAKAANIGVPVVMKKLIDQVSYKPDDPHALLVLPLAALVTYGVLRLSMTVFTELREFLFARVTQRAVRTIALKVFRHLHSLSLRFHLNRQTGGMTRDIERGTRGVGSLISYTLFNILPTLVEITLVLAYLVTHYDVWFSIITAVALFLYITFTITVTNWRTHFRRTMNELDSKANTKAIDSLINYETVKYFSNEEYEAQRYDEGLKSYETAAVKSQTSLSLLNTGQSLIIATAVTLILWRATQGVIDHKMTLGDLVLVNSFMLQLRAAQLPRRDLPRDHAKPGRHRKAVRAAGSEPRSGRRAGRAAADDVWRRAGALPARGIQLRSQAADFVRRRLHHLRRHDDGGGGPQRLGQVDLVAIAVPLLRSQRRRHHHRRPGPARRHAGLAAPRHRHRAAGYGAVQRHHRIQHRLRQAGRQQGRHRRGGQGGVDPRFHREPAGWLRVDGRGARPETVGRRKAARGDRPHAVEKSRHPDLRRSHVGAGLARRAGHPGAVEGDRQEPHHAGHRPSLVDGGGRAADSGARPRPHR